MHLLTQVKFLLVLDYGEFLSNARGVLSEQSLDQMNYSVAIETLKQDSILAEVVLEVGECKLN